MRKDYLYVYYIDARSEPGYWDRQADWEITRGQKGYLIKNVKYTEYLYAASDDLSYDENHRSVFTWKTVDDLGDEGFWTFEIALANDYTSKP